MLRVNEEYKEDKLIIHHIAQCLECCWKGHTGSGNEMMLGHVTQRDGRFQLTASSLHVMQTVGDEL